VTALLRLRRDERGAAVIEMAIILPVLVVFIYGIFQIGIMFQANAGMQHGLGEGARLATLCYNPSINGCGTPTNDEIKTRISAKVFGTKVGTFSEPTVTDGPSGSNYKTLSVTFTMTPDFLFFQAPPVNLTRSKRVYVAH
jgi:Flp pilus assembly protein TadG